MPKKLTQAEFVAKAQIIHGPHTYDYSKVVYEKAIGKVAILCLAHGAFMQTPNKHLQNRGCPECGHKSRALAKSHSAASFFRKARAVHSDTYDYTTALYTPGSEGRKATIKIECPLHGYFEQGSSNHLAGNGCPDCKSDKVNGSRIRRSKEEFEQKARAVHGAKYDYSQLDYKKAHSPALIICPEHGPFSQAPNSHLNGSGCPSCGIQLIIESKTYSKEQFVQKAISKHGQKYDYTVSEYLGSHTKIAIRCVVHGIFTQNPSSHLVGSGCPDCGLALIRSHWVLQAKGRPATLYFLQISGPSQEIFYKVGITYKSTAQRFAGKSIYPYSYTVLALYKSVNAQSVYDWEQSILETFAHLSYTPKRPFEGSTECFAEADPILAALPVGTSFY
jgi:predicted  nucleic acid-binding Zn-ribbon protein